MLKRLRLPSPAMVVALIALFAALGGGYAMAFSGSGSLQKASVNGLPDGGYAPVRTLTGFGTLKAGCFPGENAISIRYDNSSSSDVQIEGTYQDGNTVTGFNASVAADVEDFLVSIGDADGVPDTARLHMWKTAPDNKAQIDLSVAANGVAADCSNSAVRILALNTQQ